MKGGSSPHTRGLPEQASDRLEGSRIIPAHAGFTMSHRDESRPNRDHPRTRGVYHGSSRRGRDIQGSSPHTRGLQGHSISRQTSSRIIPAHAGFTTGGGCSCRTRRDHPRTRGVYLWAHQADTLRRGSSPHTRGLLPPPVVGGGILRIIPAHAGFTQRYVLGAAESADHPRTRGVYPGDGDMTLG